MMFSDYFGVIERHFKVNLKWDVEGKNLKVVLKDFSSGDEFQGHSATLLYATDELTKLNFRSLCVCIFSKVWLSKLECFIFN